MIESSKFYSGRNDGKPSKNQTFLVQLPRETKSETLALRQWPVARRLWIATLVIQSWVSSM